MGLDFGIWAEPRMISENSELYRAHKDRAMTISEMFSRSGGSGKLPYKYILGLYEIPGRLTAKYPDVLTEDCAGGGGRFDAGMLFCTPNIWRSGNTDALGRMSIHYGISFAFPNDDERLEISKQIRQYRIDREIITEGLYYRLNDPETDNYFAWEYVFADGMKAIICAVIPNNHGNMPAIYITPRGLTPGAYCSVSLRHSPFCFFVKTAGTYGGFLLYRRERSGYRLCT